MNIRRFSILIATILLLFASTTFAQDLSPSPDGLKLAYCQNGNLIVETIETGEEKIVKGVECEGVVTWHDGTDDLEWVITIQNTDDTLIRTDQGPSFIEVIGENPNTEEETVEETDTEEAVEDETEDEESGDSLTDKVTDLIISEEAQPLRDSVSGWFRSIPTFFEKSFSVIQILAVALFVIIFLIIRRFLKPRAQEGRTRKVGRGCLQFLISSIIYTILGIAIRGLWLLFANPF